MKKIMMATALAAFCGAVMADAIESANVVGYTKPALTRNTLQNSGVCFINTSGTDISLQSIKAYSGDSPAGDGTFKMRWFNGGKYDYAVWCDPVYDPADPEEDLGRAGWGTDDDDLVEITKTFPAGGWFLVSPTATSPSLEVSGALVSADTTRAVYSTSLTRNTLQVSGNPFPVACNLQSIVPMSGDSIAGDGTFKMRWFNGGKYDYAVWCDPVYDPADPEKDLGRAGWGTDDDDLVEITKTFGVGEGFLVSPTANNPKLAFPNPLYVAP